MTLFQIKEKLNKEYGWAVDSLIDTDFKKFKDGLLFVNPAGKGYTVTAIHKGSVSQWSTTETVAAHPRVFEECLKTQLVKFEGSVTGNYVYVVDDAAKLKEVKEELLRLRDKYSYAAAATVASIDAKPGIFELWWQHSYKQNPQGKFIFLNCKNTPLSYPASFIVKEDYSVTLNPRNDFIDIVPLGASMDHYYYASNYKNGTIKVPISHPRAHIMALAPDKYWRANPDFIKVDGKGNEKLDHHAIGAYLMELSADVGAYTDDGMRSSGYYRNDEGNLYCRSGFSFYGKPKKGVHHDFGQDIYVPAEAPKGNLNPLFYMLENLCWDKPYDWKVLAGWLLLAPFCGAIDYRPHVWINGERASGKTWTFESLACKALGNLYKGFTLATTEAGIIRSLRGQALPIIHDEFESENERKAADKQKVLEFLRGCSTSSGDHMNMTKGRTNNSGTQAFQACSMALLGSIKNSLEQPADRARYVIVNLNINKRDVDKFREVQGLMKMHKPWEMMKDHVNYFFHNFKELYSDKINAREQELMQLYPDTCFHSLRCIAAIDTVLKVYGKEFEKAEIDGLVESFDQQNEKESENCLNHLLFYQFWINGRKTNIHSLVINTLRSQGEDIHNVCKKDLLSLGVRVITSAYSKADVKLRISDKNRLLHYNVMRQYHARNWRSILLTDSQVTEDGPSRIVLNNYMKYVNQGVQ